MGVSGRRTGEGLTLELIGGGLFAGGVRIRCDPGNGEEVMPRSGRLAGVAAAAEERRSNCKPEVLGAAGRITEDLAGRSAASRLAGASVAILGETAAGDAELMGFLLSVLGAEALVRGDADGRSMALRRGDDASVAIRGDAVAGEAEPMLGVRPAACLVSVMPKGR